MNFQLAQTRLSKLAQVVRSAQLVSALARHRVLAGTEHRHLLAQDWATVVDIGANRGQFALAARHWSPRARIFSFEPLEAPASIFRSVFAGDTRVVLHQVAVGAQSEEAEIHISGKDDASSLLPISELQEEIFPGTAQAATAMIQVEPLDSLLAPEDVEAPALLKLDVQGFEITALKGCDSLLHRFDAVYVECSFVELYSGQALADEVVAYLRERNLNLRGVHNMAYHHGKALQGDFLFTRK